MLSRFSVSPSQAANRMIERISGLASRISKNIEWPRRLSDEYKEALRRVVDGDKDTSLKDIALFEHLSKVPLISIFDVVSTRDRSLSSAIIGTVASDKSIPESLEEALIEADAKWTVSYSGTDRSPVVDWMIPKDLADLHGMRYHAEWWKKGINRFSYVLSDCGHVVRVKDLRDAKRGSLLISGHGVGISTPTGRWFKLFRSTQFLKEGMPGWVRKILEDVNIFKEYDDDAELDAFAAAYCAFGNPSIAYMIAKNADNASYKQIEKMMSHEKVSIMVSDRTRSAMLAKLKERGLGEETGEGWVIGQHMDLIEKIMDLDTVDSRMSKVVQDSLEKLGEYLDMTGEREKVTTTQTLQITGPQGTAIAQQIEQRRQAQLAESDEVVDGAE